MKQIPLGSPDNPCAADADDDVADADDVIVLDWKQFSAEAMVAFDEALNKYGLEIINYETGGDTYVVAIQRKENDSDKCSICAGPLTIGHDLEIGWRHGRNAQPINNGRCCETCDNTVVIPARIARVRRGMSAYG